MAQESGEAHMTDGAPKRIWAVHHETLGAVMTGEWADSIRRLGGIEYILAAEHERLMAERDAEIARLREALTALVKTHDRENFMRSADFHREDCRCLRCAFDRARAALGDDNE